MKRWLKRKLLVRNNHDEKETAFNAVVSALAKP